MPKPVLQDTLWAGTEASLEAHVKQLEVAEQRMALSAPSDQPTTPRLLEIKDGIGVVSIKGPLSNRDSFMSFLMGASTYPAIREALMAAATDAEVQHIVLDVDSGGGSVAGVSDVANLISAINTKVKPVTAFTDGLMMSAAYWLGSAAGEVVASKTAAVGSIGVISTHMEQSQRLKDEGIGVTVMRAGKYKALANSVEPLTEAAKDQIQASLDAAYGVFVDHVAQARGVSYQVADKQMAQGQEFFGQGAKEAGLVDQIEPFDAMMSRISADIIDKRTHITQNRAKSTFHTGLAGKTEVTMPKAALTEQDIAALAAGGATPPAAVASPEPEAAALDAPASQAAASDAPASQAAAPEAAAPPANELVSYLQGRVVEQDKELVALKVSLASATERLTAAEAVTKDLVAIAAKSVSHMTVALGGSAVDLSATAPLAVVTEYQKVSARFQEKFKVGGVAAVDSAAPQGEDLPNHPFLKARAAAASFHPK